MVNRNLYEGAIPYRTHYEKKDSLISRKYRWLEDLNQRDPDLDGIEISEASLELLKKKRQDLVSWSKGILAYSSSSSLKNKKQNTF